MANGQKLQKFNAAATTSLNIIFVSILLFVLAIFAVVVYTYFYIKRQISTLVRIEDVICKASPFRQHC